MLQRIVSLEHGNTNTSRDCISRASDVLINNKDQTKPASREHERHGSPPLTGKEVDPRDPLEGSSRQELNPLLEIEPRLNDVF